jgi:hypothetical protein
MAFLDGRFLRSSTVQLIPHGAVWARPYAINRVCQAFHRAT